VALAATQPDIFKGIVGNGTTSLESGRFLHVMKRKSNPEGHFLQREDNENVTGAERENCFCLKNISR